MDTVDRLIVESIKRAKRIDITIDGEITFSLDPNKKLHHDIALAYQSAVINRKSQNERH